VKFPYAGLPSYQILSRAVAEASGGTIDPQHAARFTVDRTTRIASAGSCFAQRIAERLRDAGYNYFVAEPGPMWEAPEALAARGYGAYSARFGDIYTTLQLVQLARRATGAFSPQEPPWPVKGGVADPFRPRVEPHGFASAAELEADRAGVDLGVVADHDQEPGDASCPQTFDDMQQHRLSLHRDHRLR